MPTGVESNFDVVSTAFATTQGLEYDFNSLMHYDAYAFSRNGRPTIEPVDPSISLDSLGQRDDLSMGDLKHVNTLYCGASEQHTVYPLAPSLFKQKLVTYRGACAHFTSITSI